MVKGGIEGRKNNRTNGATQAVEIGEDENKAKIMEEEHVHKVYDAIASHFSSTRSRPWPKVLDFAQSFKKGSMIMDIGAGNGKNLGLTNTTVVEIAVDRCHTFATMCRTQGRDSLVADTLFLPFRDAIADGILCIAVLHHLGTSVRRKQAIQEIIRILRPGGRALITVWALEQPRGFASSDSLVPWSLQRRFDSKSTTGPAGDVVAVHQRYYHLFCENELSELIQSVTDYSVRICESAYDNDNWYVILQKL